MNPTTQRDASQRHLIRWLAISAVLITLAFGSLVLYARLPKPLADVSMTDHHGKTVKLSDYRGKWLLIYFGYTGCPDACPTGLGEIAKALKEMGPDRKAIQPLFISLDPKNDTSNTLKTYLPYFDPDFIGLRVEEPGLAKVVKQFGVSYVTAESPTKGTLIDHSLYAYLIDPKGVMKDAFATTFPPDFLRKRMAKHGWKGGAHD